MFENSLLNEHFPPYFVFHLFEMLLVTNKFTINRSVGNMHRTRCRPSFHYPF